MYNKRKADSTSLKVNKSYKGETMEKKVYRILNNKEPIKEPGVVLIYTDRKDGVRPEMNIRTDVWELALDAMDKVTADKLTKRLDRQAERDKLNGGDGDLKGIVNDGGAKSTQGGNAENATQ